VEDVEDVVGFGGLISNIALSRKRVRALDEERRNAMRSLVVRVIVRG
jgi:hypothetical protein